LTTFFYGKFQKGLRQDYEKCLARDSILTPLKFVINTYFWVYKSNKLAECRQTLGWWQTKLSAWQDANQ